MNERIRELELQCYVTITKAGLDGCHEKTTTIFDKEKFAELIVAECMTTMLKESKWYWDRDEFESSNAIQNATRRVKDHFGVEE